VLEKGRIVFEGDAKNAVEHYARRFSTAEPTNETHAIDLTNAPGRHARYRPRLRKLEVLGGNGEPLGGELRIGSPLRLCVEFELPHPTAAFDVRIDFLDLYGQVIFAARSSYEPDSDWGERHGLQRMICDIADLPLTPGERRMDVTLALEGNHVVDRVEDAYRLYIGDSDFYGTGQIPSAGFMVHRQHWRLD
jgi:hypothetical protein